MYNNIMLSGGNTMFPGIVSRIDGELRKLLQYNYQHYQHFEIIDRERRMYTAFIGLSIISRVFNSNVDYWISKGEWEENGYKIIEKKCHCI